MSTHKSSEDQEVDLSAITRGISNFFGGINKAIFNGIRFVFKNLILIGILFVLGISIGVYLDKTQKTYNHQIIVTPNFGTTDYLYSKIDLLESKINERDTVFLKSIGIANPSKLTKIEIEPIVDIYKFINSSELNFQLLKLMAEDGDLKKIVTEKSTSKNFPYHIISFATREKTTGKKTIDPLMKFLNNSEFYLKMQKEYVNNLKMKIEADNLVITQIDGFLNSFSDKVNGNSKNDKLVYYNENSQLNDVIKTKDKFVEELGNIRINLVGFDQIIKESSRTLNIENTKSVNGKLKFILPFLFTFIFIFIVCFMSLYKKASLVNRKE